MHYRVRQRNRMKSRAAYVAVILVAILVSPACVHEVGAQQDDANAKQWAGTLLAPKAFRTAIDKVGPSLVTIEAFVGIGE